MSDTVTTDQEARRFYPWFELVYALRSTGEVTNHLDPVSYDEAHNQLKAHQGCYSPVVWVSVQEAGVYPIGSKLPGSYPVKGDRY